MVEVGLSENIELVDSGGTNIEQLFGAFASASFIIDESTRREGTIGNDGKPTAILDGPVENRATIECKPETLEILKIMGSYDSNAGTIDFTAELPTLNELNGQFTANERFNFTDVKIGGFTLTSELDDSVLLEFDPVHAESAQVQQQTVSVSPVDGSPLQWTDTVFKINGSQFGTTESVNSSLNRNISAEHGLGEGREPAAIVEGNFDINLSFVIKVEDASAWEELLDDTTYPLTVQSSRSPINELSIDFGDGNGELVVTNGKAEINTFDMDEEKDVRTVELSLQAEDISVRNL